MKKFLSIYLCLILLLGIPSLIVQAEPQSNPDSEFVECKVQTLISDGSMNGFIWNLNEGNNSGQRPSITTTPGSHITVKLDLRSTSSSSAVLGTNLNLEPGDIYTPGAYTPVSLDGVKENGFLRFTVRSAVVPNEFKVKFTNQGWGWTDSTLCDISNWTAGEWCNIDLPIKDINPLFWGGGFNLTNIVRITLNPRIQNKTLLELDIKEISVWNKAKPAEVSFVSAEMDKTTGKYAVDVEFSKGILPGSITTDAFVLDTLPADSFDYDEDSKTCRILFDTLPQFPGEFTLRIEGGVLDEDSLPVSAEIAVRNSILQSEATFTGDTTFSYADNVLQCVSNVKCIYASESAGQEMCVFVALFQGDKIIASGISELQTLAWKESDDFAVNVQGVTSLDGIRAEVYIIDNVANGKPLAEQMDYASVQ